jgi:hypothetical protein
MPAQNAQQGYFSISFVVALSFCFASPIGQSSPTLPTQASNGQFALARIGACRRQVRNQWLRFSPHFRRPTGNELSVGRRISFGPDMQDKRDNYRSPLERRPKFVKAIGMISIENSSLEVLLAELFAALLGIHGEFGILIYFTPKAAIPRLDMIVTSLSPHWQAIPSWSRRFARSLSERRPRSGDAMTSCTRFGLLTIRRTVCSRYSCPH